MVPAAEVEAARAALREHIDDLCSIEHHKIETDEGEVRNATTPALIDQVAGEIAGNSQNRGPNAWASKPPLWLDGSSLLMDIQREVVDYRGPLTIAVRQWGADMASGTPGQVVDAERLAGGWVAAARQLLNPKPRVRFAGQSCPSCGAERVWDRHDRDNQESYARPALEIDTERGSCVCRACGQEWPPELWEMLAMVLEQQREETLAATSWDGA
jgi:hypothetical protein